jgi:hypothetical protein
MHASLQASLSESPLAFAGRLVMFATQPPLGQLIPLSRDRTAGRSVAKSQSAVAKRLFFVRVDPKASSI